MGGYPPESKMNAEAFFFKTKQAEYKSLNHQKVGAYAPESVAFASGFYPLGAYAPESGLQTDLVCLKIPFLAFFWVHICRNGRLFIPF